MHTAQPRSIASQICLGIYIYFFAKKNFFCQYFFGQLPIEQTIDYKKFKFLRKIIYSEESCELNIIYKFLSKIRTANIMYKIQSGFQSENFSELVFENIVECSI